MISFDEYVQTRLASLLRLAAVLSGDAHLAEDLVQEVLLRASTRWDRIPEPSVDAYVRRMVTNEYLSWRRKWARVVPRANVDVEESVKDPSERYVDRDELSAGLSRLPKRQRAVVVLRFYEDLSIGEIAHVLDCTAATVRSHLSRALSTLRVAFVEAEFQDVRRDGGDAHHTGIA